MKIGSKPVIKWRRPANCGHVELADVNNGLCALLFLKSMAREINLDSPCESGIGSLVDGTTKASASM